MNLAIFIDFVDKLNKKLNKKKKSMLFFIDNCSAHPTNTG